MRMRNKPWAKEELNKSKIYISSPEENKGKWKEIFKKTDNPIHLELGCGKGFFVKKAARQNPNINYIAIDMIEAMLGLSKRNIEEKLGKEPKNVLLIRANAERIFDIFGEKDKVNRIYINFCNPWPKSKHNKRRLTHPRQLENYKKFLGKSGEIYFKTDDLELFEAILEYFKQSGFQAKNITYDLDKEQIFEENIETEHEKMFKEQEIKIKAGIFVRTV